MRITLAYILTGLVISPGPHGSLAMPAASQQASGAEVSPSRVIVGDVAWGKTFKKDLAGTLALSVDLLGGPNDAQNGIMVSVINRSNPANHQFVMLPELINGWESNFVGVFVGTSMDPRDVSERLRQALERARYDLPLTYFTATLGEAQLQAIEEANLTIGHHGRSEAEYAKAHAVLDRVEKTIGVFKVLDYKLAEDPARPGALHIDQLTFSFDPGSK